MRPGHCCSKDPKLKSSKKLNLNFQKKKKKRLNLLIDRSVAIRVATSFWWFFTLIIVSSYTANLAAFLVAESSVTMLEGVEDFANCGLPHQPPCKAKFGTKEKGSTLKFFEVCIETDAQKINQMLTICYFA